MRKTTNVKEALTAIGNVANKALATPRAAVTSVEAACRQVMSDRADRKISDDQERAWLDQKGNPRLLTAQHESQRAVDAVDAEEITPMVNEWLQHGPMRSSSCWFA